MSIVCMNYVWQQSETTGADRLMLLALADSCNDDGEWSPGVTKLAKKCQVSERAAQYTLKRLSEMGEIEIHHQQGFKTKTGHTNKYVMKRYRLATGLDKEVQQTAPLNADAVQPTAPRKAQAVQPTAPVGVQPTAPKPSVLPTSKTEPSLASADDDVEVKTVKTLSNTLQGVGVGLTQFMIDQYVDLVKEHGLVAVVSGIQTAAQNGKQHRYKYVAACIANLAQGHRNPPTSKPTDNQPIKVIYTDLWAQPQGSKAS